MVSVAFHPSSSETGVRRHPGRPDREDDAVPRPTPARLRATVCVAPAMLLLLLAALVHPAPAQAASLPSKSQWVADTYDAMQGSRAYVGRRADQGGSRLAVNLDIDNTSLASHYDYGAPVAVTLRFARYARDHGVKLLFNTGRIRGDGRLAKAKALLRAAGYRVTEICGRTSTHETLTHSKQRCRRHFVAEGWTLVANVGNRQSDFTGGSYEKAFRLPSYGGRLA